MAKRKIADCINVRINVGNYQHIELTKYAEEEIEYSTDLERTQKEESLRDDLVTSLIKSMKAIPERLNKGGQNAQEVEESIKKSIPAWLANGTVPNIANMAKKQEVQVTAEQKSNKDDYSKDSAKDMDVFEDPKPESKEEMKQVLSIIDSKPDIPEIDKVDASDLFEEDKASVSAVVSEVKEVKEAKKISIDKKSEFDDIFDDDIFDDK